MRLLTLDKHGVPAFTPEYLDAELPPYAILSHTWGAEADEVTYKDISESPFSVYSSKAGFSKIRFCGEQARKDGLEYFWVDSCCINKPNFTELSEAILSMFRWYRQSQKCYVFLADVTALKRRPVSWEDGFRNSKWFHRGWTLQELIAPPIVEFFTRDRSFLGTKLTLEQQIHQVTSIPISVLRGEALSEFSPNERLRWAQNRQTKKPEDRVYSLLGIFDVIVPIQYGAGYESAFQKLGDEITRRWSQLDKSILNPNHMSRPAANTTEGAERRDRRRKQLLDSLRFDQMGDREKTIKNPQRDTCEWLFAHPLFTIWNDVDRRRDHEPILWISGKPGAGKSTLMKTIHTRAVQRKGNNDMICHFFFNARGSSLEKSIIGLYRVLLLQLLQQVPDLQYLLDGIAYPAVWSVSRGQSLIRQAVQGLEDRHLKCYIDALDECDEEDVRDMVDYLEELQNDVPQTCHFSVCFASRHYPTIDVRNGRRLVLENEPGHGDDLRLYIHHHLRAPMNRSGDEIREQICQKANGVFVWTVFVINILNREIDRGRMFAVKQRLNEMPPKLSDLFADMLTRDNLDMDALLLCLQLILFAEMPLTPAQFYFAMEASVHLGDECWTPEPWDREELTSDVLLRFVSSASKGLAELTKSEISPTVQFIHESVRDYLLKDGGLSSLWPHIGVAASSFGHDRLKQICSRYIRTRTKSTKSASSLPSTGTGEYPWLDYALRFALLHADEAALHISQQDFVNEFEIWEWIRLMHFDSSLLRRDCNPMGYFCAMGNRANLLRLVDKKHHWANILRLGADGQMVVGSTPGMLNSDYSAGNSHAMYYGFPVLVAFDHGHREALQVMFEDVEPHVLEEMFSDPSFGRVDSTLHSDDPLIWAARNRCWLFFDLLLMHYPITSDPQQRAALLVFAARDDRQALASRLLELGTDVNLASVRSSDNALVAACRNGHGSMASLLLTSGAEMRSVVHWDPLQSACSIGDESLIRLLLDRGADPNTLCLRCERHPPQQLEEDLLWRGVAQVLDASFFDGKACRTALQRVCASGSLRLASLLLQRGAKVDQCGAWTNALYDACREGHHHVAQLLLQHGADVQIQHKHFGDALRAACGSRSTATVLLLLEHGADLKDDRNCSEALLEAVQKSDETMVDLLLQRLDALRTDALDGRLEPARRWLRAKEDEAAGDAVYSRLHRRIVAYLASYMTRGFNDALARRSGRNNQLYMPRYQ